MFVQVSLYEFSKPRLTCESKINTTWSCENGASINLLKNELDFQGYVMSGMCSGDTEVVVDTDS